MKGILCLAFLVLYLLVGATSFCNAQGVGSARKTNSVKSEVTSAAEESESLCFSVDQLVKALETGDTPLKVLSKDTDKELFTLRLKGIKIMGCARKASGKIIHVTVAGIGSEFNACVEKLIRLANGANTAASAEIVARFTTNLRDKANPDENFQQDGTRYYLHRFSGVPTFHCTNARADERAIIRAQPG
jgi:hypothetical protein